ncbi:hypothetical protein FISHEDRAFT_51992 [Fistulina hepatica ATCC 64428]|nr:hypothetical protein FISHEDRAFT_51992 [Fistulina hepatica ATCC 64428]
MFSFAPFVAFFLSTSAVARAAKSTFPATPLASKHFSYPSGVPYQADTDADLERGGQSGYNLCNSTTEGQNSMCQTSFLNSLDDFCLWAPQKPNSLIADTEGEEVAWCTKPGRGTRLIPPGALTGVQYMKTPDYVQVVGFIDQTKINLRAGDSGGELDPHGADLRGNPLGGLVYSTAWSNNNDSYTQVTEWHNFMGGNFFCFKVCDPSRQHAADFCQHIYDRIGCAYNAPNNATDRVFEECQGDNQDYPGVYTLGNQVVTYSQPPESVGAITTMPYQPRVPASSNCVTHDSAQLYAALGSAWPSEPGAPATPTTTATGAPAASGSKSGASRTGSSSSAKSTGSSAESMNGAGIIGTGFAALVGAAVAIVVQAI